MLPDETKNRRLFEAVRRHPLIDLGPVSIRIALFHQTTDLRDFSSNWHSHSYYEFTLVRSGQMEYSTEQKKLPRRKGQVLVMPPNRIHSRRTVSSKCVLDGFMFEIIQTSGKGAEFAQALPGLVEKRGFSLPFSKKVHALFEEIDAEIQSGGPFTENRLHFLIHDIFFLSFRESFGKYFRETKSQSAPVTGAESGRSQHLFHLAKTYIDENYHKEISLTDVGNFLGISNRYLNQIFSKQLKLPCGRYIQERKLQRAYEIIRTRPLLKISEVARETGYESYYHFTRAFKKKFKQSPTEIRDAN